MKREELAKRIGWKYWMWLVGVINVTSMLPQIVMLLQTHDTKGISEPMFWGIGIVQAGLSAEGFFNRRPQQFLSLLVCTLMSATTIILIHYYRV